MYHPHGEPWLQHSSVGPSQAFWWIVDRRFALAKCWRRSSVRTSKPAARFPRAWIRNCAGNPEQSWRGSRCRLPATTGKAESRRNSQTGCERVSDRADDCRISKEQLLAVDDSHVLVTLLSCLRSMESRWILTKSSAMLQPDESVFEIMIFLMCGFRALFRNAIFRESKLDKRSAFGSSRMQRKW